MTDQVMLLVGVLAGGGGGFVVGRWVAEAQRAKFDQRRIWRARADYRRSKSK